MKPTTDDIMLAVQRIKKIGVKDIKSRATSPHIREARLLCYFVANLCFGKSTGVIARAMGRHPDTVRQAVSAMVKVERFSPELVDAVEDEALKIVAARQAENSLEMR